MERRPQRGVSRVGSHAKAEGTLEKQLLTSRGHSATKTAENTILRAART